MNLHQKLVEVKKKVEYLQATTDAYNFKYADPVTVLSKFNPLFLRKRSDFIIKR